MKHDRRSVLAIHLGNYVIGLLELNYLKTLYTELAGISKNKRKMRKLEMLKKIELKSLNFKLSRVENRLNP